MLNIRATLHKALGHSLPATAAAAAITLIAFSAPAQAQAQSLQAAFASQGAFVHVQFGAPPPPRYEARPAPRRGYVWAPGYWEPRGHRHVWRAGHWVKARPGYVYRQPSWSKHGNRWDYRASRWDRDGDGVPNRYDRKPNNPRRH